MAEVRDDRAGNRFVLEDYPEAFIAYRREGDRVVLSHTEVPEALSGQGVGTRLVRGALALIREEGVRVVPRCSFVAAYIKRHPEERDLVAPG